MLAGAKLIFFPEFPEVVRISWAYSADEAHKRLMPGTNLIICKEKWSGTVEQCDCFFSLQAKLYGKPNHSQKAACWAWNQRSCWMILLATASNSKGLAYPSLYQVGTYQSNQSAHVHQSESPHPVLTVVNTFLIWGFSHFLDSIPTSPSLPYTFLFIHSCLWC